MIAETEKVPINKLTWACNPRANRSSLLANQNARFAKAMLQVKHLGILIDKNLSWKHHIDHIAIKVSRTVGLITKLRHFLPTHTLLNIYQVLVAPCLTCGLAIWGQACKSYLVKLLKLQIWALRFIFFSDHNEHAIPLFVDAQVLPIKFLSYESIANLMFDVRNTTAPSNIQDLFQDISNVHSFKTRSSTSNNFYTQPSRLSIQVNSFSRIRVKVWNEIPQVLRNLSKNVFKRKLKQILFNISGSQDSYRRGWVGVCKSVDPCLFFTKSVDPPKFLFTSETTKVN